MDSEVSVTEKDFRPFARLGKYFQKASLRRRGSPFPCSRARHQQGYFAAHHKRRISELRAHTHDGWKLAQKRIAALLTDALTRREEARAIAKRCRRLRNRPGDQAARRDESRIDLEIRVLRRTLDVVLWTIVVGDHSTLRRLFVIGGKHNLSIKNIADAMPTADQINEDHTPSRSAPICCPCPRGRPAGSESQDSPVLLRRVEGGRQELSNQQDGGIRG